MAGRKAVRIGRSFNECPCVAGQSRIIHSGTVRIHTPPLSKQTDATVGDFLHDWRMSGIFYAVVSHHPELECFKVPAASGKQHLGNGFQRGIDDSSPMILLVAGKCGAVCRWRAAPIEKLLPVTL